jgi:hypothetical protein
MPTLCLVHELYMHQPSSGLQGVYLTSETLNRYILKWPEVEILYNLDLFLTKRVLIISC